MLYYSSLWGLYRGHSLGTVQDYLYCCGDRSRWTYHLDHCCSTRCHREKERCRRVCCGNDSNWSRYVAHFELSFFLHVCLWYTGTGFFKSNISPLIAEQYKRTKIFVITTRHGERVIVDPSLTVSRMYMVSSSFLSLLYEIVDHPRSSVFLPVHQHRGSHWSNFYDLR